MFVIWDVSAVLFASFRLQEFDGWVGFNLHFVCFCVAKDILPAWAMQSAGFFPRKM